MKEIIAELQANKKHEINQIGLTPRTNFKGTQIDHDLQHKKKAIKYQMAINILK